MRLIGHERLRGAQISFNEPSIIFFLDLLSNYVLACPHSQIIQSVLLSVEPFHVDCEKDGRWQADWNRVDEHSNDRVVEDLVGEEEEEAALHHEGEVVGEWEHVVGLHGCTLEPFYDPSDAHGDFETMDYQQRDQD